MIDRKTLKWGFSTESFPHFSCSRCSAGNLVALNKLEEYHPPFSRRIQQEEWADWDHVELRLSTILRCNNPHCGEQFVVHAMGGVEPDYDHRGQTVFENYYRISSIFPSPHLFDLPTGLPDNIKHHLVASFDNYWQHKNLAANALRNALEELLTHFGVPKEVNGKWISLGNRLIGYAKNEKEHAEFFNILKPIVNAGSHGQDVETDTLLDTYEALELFLDEVFSQRSLRFQELKSRLTENT